MRTSSCHPGVAPKSMVLLYAWHFGKRQQERIDYRMRQLEFFKNESALPDGLIYSAEFISRDEEGQLVAAIGESSVWRDQDARCRCQATRNALRKEL